MKKPAMIAVSALAVLIVIAGAIGWNAAWRYDTANLFVDGAYSKQAVQVRTHLITGRAERLTGYGWVPLEYRPTAITRQVEPAVSPSAEHVPSQKDPFADLGR